MADELKTILIKDLQEADSAADTDYIAIDNGTVTKKIRVDNYNKTANGTAKSYAESAKESADKAQRNADSVSSTVTEITNNITAAQSAAIQAEKSAEAAESATLNLQTYVNAAKESADKAKASEESTKNVADKIADSNKIAQSYAVGGTNYRTGEDTDNARYYYSGAKTAEANAETYKTNASTSASAAAASEVNAKTSETNAAKSASSASSSAESATASKTAAATSEQNASNSANYAMTNATRAESYAIGGTSSRSGEDTDNAKYYAQQAKKSAELAAGSITGVSSFNNRTGTVTPASGDYKADQVTYDNTASGISANTVQSAIDKIAESDAKKAVKTDVDSALNLKANKTDVASSLSGKQDNLGIKSIGSNLTLSNGVLDAKGQITVDTALSTTSANPVQNKVVAAAINSNASKIIANTSAIATKSDSTVTDQLAKNTAQIETAGTATNAHSEGEYVMISNALYKVAASVAEGDTWIIGTNVTAANVGSEINALVSKTDNMKASFQAGVDGIYNAITAQGTTPASKSQSDVQAAISTLANNSYNKGYANKTLHQVIIGTGGNGNYSATDVPNWQGLTNDNFAFVPTKVHYWGGTYNTDGTAPYVTMGTSASGDIYPSVSYNAGNGVVTVTGCSAEAYSNGHDRHGAAANVAVTGNIYCVVAN